MTVTNRQRAELARDALESFRRATNATTRTASATCSATSCTSATSTTSISRPLLSAPTPTMQRKKPEDVNGNFMNISCRQCGRADELDVEILVWARLTDDGTDIDEAHQTDHEWDDNSFLHCDHCGHSETIGANKKPPKRLRSSAKKGGAA
jgi:hypothetical protein